MKPLSDDYRLYGKNIYLRPITFEDIDMVLDWRNSDYVMQCYFYRVPISHDEQHAWIANKVKSGSVFQFIVCLKDGTPVGCVYLQRFDESENSMESGVFMSPDAPQGKGIGTEAVALMNNDFAFKELKLNKTTARIIDQNAGSIRLHEKAGFILVGRATENIVPTGEKVNALEYEIINSAI